MTPQTLWNPMQKLLFQAPPELVWLKSFILALLIDPVFEYTAINLSVPVQTGAKEHKKRFMLPKAVILVILLSAGSRKEGICKKRKKIQKKRPR